MGKSNGDPLCWLAVAICALALALAVGLAVAGHIVTTKGSGQ